MSESTPDHYETLQVSPNADAETIQRVYRLLAQRYHPDNQLTGNEDRFRGVHEAYTVLGDPDARVRYDAAYASTRQDRWRIVHEGPPSATDFELEAQTRGLVLEILYSRRRMEPSKPGVSPLDLAELTGRPHEHLDFTIWYLVQKKFVTRDDQSNLTITVDGVEHLEQQLQQQSQRRLSS